MGIKGDPNNRALSSVFVAALVLSSLSNATRAAEVQVEFRTGVGYSDNINRDTTASQDETIGRVGATLNATSEGKRLEFDIVSSLDYQHYVDGTYDDDVIGGLNGMAKFKLVDDRLQWYVLNNFGQRTANPLAAPTPANREDINFFTTGPSLRLPLGRRNEVGVEALYSTVNYELRNLDNTKKEGRLWFGREIRRSLNASLNARTSGTEFDDAETNTDYDILEGFFRIEKPTSRGVSGYEFDLGYSDLEFGESESSSGLLIRAAITKYFGPNTNLVLLGGTGYSDTASLFRFNQDADFARGATQYIDGNGIPFRNDYIDLSYNYNLERTRANFRIGWQRQDYEGRATQDRDLYSANVTLQRELTRKVFGRVGLGATNLNYETLDRDDRITSFRIGAGYRFGSTLTLRIDYDYTRRTSNVPESEFTENRVFLNFAYSPRWDDAI